MSTTLSLHEYISVNPPFNTFQEAPISPEELEFFAEQEIIEIIPNFKLSTPGSMLYCIEGSFGPFQPNVPAEVPIYIALTLYRRNKCRILPPRWLSTSHLEVLVKEERQVSQHFQAIPFYYIEISKLLMTEASSIFGLDFTEIQNLLEEFKKIRNGKIQDGLSKVNGAITVRLTNLSANECNRIRVLFTSALNVWNQIGKNDRKWQEERRQGPM
uniref:DNA replication complex GINS protein PSF2 n=1 Tax=Polytomella parva TaxID=51329 RepID=A0A7S0UUL9_9CHLO|mmetsp:Transcript_18690/g.33921  ORF Transcript_18690/g.33921 Transcript_18690/m.33921 type:complete len:214 (+) Transcript_18690:82-723(+)